MKKFLTSLFAAGMLAASTNAATLTVNSTADNLTSDSFLTLREAVVLIDNNGVANTAASLNRVLTAGEQAQISGSFGNDKIILPAGTIVLTIPGTGEGSSPALPKIGDLDITVSGVTIQGAGAASTTIQQTSGVDRLFDVNVNFDPNFVFMIDGVTIAGGRESSGNGGAIFTGSPSGVSSLTAVRNCKFINNQVTGGGFGGGALLTTGGDLIVSNCVFGGTGATDKNTSATSGGAIGYDAYGFASTLTVTNCTFTNNTAASVSAGGGAIDLANVNLSTGTYNIGGSIFSGNQATGASGGAIVHESGTLNITACTFITNHAGVAGGAVYSGGQTTLVTFCRLIGNNASNAGNGQALHTTGGPFTANNNWWGVNTGPTVSDIKNVTATNWLQLRHAANPNSIAVAGSTTLTATFLTNSAGTAIPATSLGRLNPIPITFNNAVRGTLSGAAASIQAATATATFTANATGAGGADAVVDSQTVTAPVTISTSVSSINRVNLSPTNLSSVQWTATFASAVSGVTAGNFGLVNAGLGGSPAITSVVAVGGAPATAWTVTATTGTGTGTLGLNLTNSTGVSASIGNLPFTGQVYSIDLVAPNTSITAQPAALTNTSTAGFSFNGTDTGVGVAVLQYQLDGSAYTNGTSPVTFSSLSSAVHTFNVRAIDSAGNTDATPATVTWTVDTIPPTVNCSSDITVTSSGYCPPVVNYVVSVSDNLAISVATTNPASGSVFAVGTNIVALGARDTAGNTNFCTFKVIVQPGAAPQLNIVRTGTNAVISWSNSFPCYVLQVAPAVASNSWSIYPGPFATNAGNIFVTNSAAIANQFFRLSF